MHAGALALPIPARMKVRVYYRLFTPFFEILTDHSGILNYGQESLVRTTAASLPRPGRWLDVGCGVGGPACLLAREMRDVEIVGINITGHQVEAAERRAREEGVSERARFRIGDACAMPFPGDGGFDGVYSIEAAFHFPDKAAFAREARRMLRPGGRFACADMIAAEGRLPLFHRMFHRWLGVLRLHTLSAWRRDLEAAGFSDVQSVDLTHTVLGPGLRAANDRIREMHSALQARFPKLLIEAVRLGNDWVLRDLDAQPIRYALITARGS